MCDAASITVVQTSQNEPCMPPIISSVDDSRRAVPGRQLKPLPPAPLRERAARVSSRPAEGMIP